MSCNTIKSRGEKAVDNMRNLRTEILLFTRDHNLKKPLEIKPIFNVDDFYAVKYSENKNDVQRVHFGAGIIQTDTFTNDPVAYYKLLAGKFCLLPYDQLATQTPFFFVVLKDSHGRNIYCMFIKETRFNQ